MLVAHTNRMVLCKVNVSLPLMQLVRNGASHRSYSRYHNQLGGQGGHDGSTEVKTVVEDNGTGRDHQCIQPAVAHELGWSHWPI